MIPEENEMPNNKINAIRSWNKHLQKLKAKRRTKTKMAKATKQKQRNK